MNSAFEKLNSTVRIETIEEIDFSLNTQLKVLFVLSGHLEVMRNGKGISVQMGDVFILNRGEIISMIGSSENAILVVSIPTNFYYKELPQFQLNRPLSVVYQKELHDKLVQILAALYVEMTTIREGSEYMIEGFLKNTIGTLLRYIPKIKADASTDKDMSRKIEEVMDYINAHYHQKITLDSLAESFFINKYYLAHTFKKQLKTTIGNYIKEVRLFHSIKELENTDKKIIEIALHNGFSNARSFSTVFKEKHGISPADFRKKKRENRISVQEVIKTNDFYLDLLMQYIAEDDFVFKQRLNATVIEEKINMVHVIARQRKRDYLLKVHSTNLNYLSKVKNALGIKYVSITGIIDKLDINFRNDQLEIDFSLLDKIIRKILEEGLFPYLQLQVLDYEQWLTNGFPSSKRSFKEVMLRLKYHLGNEYPNFSDWYIEFRCFYESKQTAKICLPLVDLIIHFNDYTKVMVHFPELPTEAVNDNYLENKYVYCIDDYTKVKAISLNAALENLQKEKYIQIIREQENMTYQEIIMQRILDYENDAYLSKYKDLTLANTHAWNYIQSKNTDVHYFSPLSLDTKKPFEYFPIELSQMMSLYDRNGLVTERYFVYGFLNQLHEEIVYRSDFCVITKKQDNYCLLFLYPEEEVLHFMEKKANYRSQTTIKEIKQPYIQMKFLLSGLKGDYKITQQELNPGIIDRKTELKHIKECNYLSGQDRDYYNVVSQPTRTIKEVTIEKEYLLELEVPIIGIALVKLEKIY